MKSNISLSSKKRNLIGAIGVIVFVFAIPLLFPGQRYIMVLLTTISINVIICSGLDILYGYSGQISMGHAAFYAMGAYGSAILSKTGGLSPWLTIFIVSALTAAFAFLFALPITKLVFMFLSLVTIALGEVVYQSIVVIFPDYTGGTIGFSSIPRFQIGGFVIRERPHYLILVLVFTVLAITMKQMLIKSRVGRALIAIRENTTAAGGMGINVRFYKSAAFAVSAFYTALAGALYAHFVGYISPETFNRAASAMFITMILFGGNGTLAGPVLGATILNLFSEVIQAFGRYQMFFYGFLIIFVVMFAPQGLMGIISRIYNFFTVKVRLGKTWGNADDSAG
ncbi:MAG: branched-chain amino acid ABC transporter permease [Treponema sp.]|jgi:branched-chain amino acid transport system permease protein|nr:branched-chain amino acid ABC transporter permease [Treponema sp.]